MGKIDRVLCAYPNAGPGDFELRNDGSGTFISNWNEAKLGPKPDLSALPEPGPEYHEAQKALALNAAIGRRELRAVIIWAANRFGIPPAQARDEILATYKGL